MPCTAEVTGLQVLGQHEAQALPFEGGFGQDRTGSIRAICMPMTVMIGIGAGRGRCLLSRRFRRRRASSLDVAGTGGWDDVGAYQTDEHAGGRGLGRRPATLAWRSTSTEHVHVAELDGVDDVEAGQRIDRRTAFRSSGRSGKAEAGRMLDAAKMVKENQKVGEEEHRGGGMLDGEGADAGIGGTVALVYARSSREGGLISRAMPTTPGARKAS